jgi:hypothetical protein
MKSAVGEGLVCMKFLISNKSIQMFGKKTTRTAASCYIFYLKGGIEEYDPLRM